MKNNKFTNPNPDPMDLAPYQTQGDLWLNIYQDMYEDCYKNLDAKFPKTSRLYDNSKTPDGHFAGPMVTKSRYISQDNINARSNAIMFGAAYVDTNHYEADGHEDLVPCAIVNTRNEGFQYVVEDDDGMLRAIDPVSHACFVGGTDRPAAILIPINGEIAPIADGMKILCEIEKKYRESINERDPNCIPNGSPRAELPKAPFEVDEENFDTFKISERFI